MVEKFIMAGETPLHICDSEQGEKCVVLLHGYLESMLVWDDFIPLLYKDVRVVTLDLPGHGLSVVMDEVHTMEFLAETVASAMKVLGVERYAVVGHSMGGYVALALASLHPEVLDGLVLFHATPNADSTEKHEKREREIALIKAGKKELLGKVAPAARLAPHNRARMKSYMEDCAEQIFITEDEGVLAILRGMGLRRDQHEMLRQSGVRQLFIYGKHDEYIPMEMAEAVVASHPQAEVVWLEQSGHMGFLEEPGRSAEAILSFVS